MSEHTGLEFAPQSPRSQNSPLMPPLVLFIISMSQMTEAKMTPSPPCFGAKIFDFRSSTVPILTLKIRRYILKALQFFVLTEPGYIQELS